MVGPIPSISKSCQSAQVVKSRDLASVAEASKQNEARFERDYKGRTFEDRISFAGMEKPMFGGVGYDVRLGTSGFLHAAQCRISDQATIDFLTDHWMEAPDGAQSFNVMWGGRLFAVLHRPNLQKPEIIGLEYVQYGRSERRTYRPKAASPAVLESLAAVGS